MQIPITKPYIDQTEIEYVTKVLESGWLVQGKYVTEFENRLAEFVGSKYAIAVNSCTSGQFLSSIMLNLKKGDEVIVPAFTWISTANCIDFFEAKPVFCDIDFDTFNIDITQIEELITSRTKAIYPVNLFGLPSNMPKIKQIAEKHDISVIEDCACGLGGKISGKHCGTFGDIGIFSFHPRKSITTGEGGMIITDNESYASLTKSLREHGAQKSDFERHQGQDTFLLTEYNRIGFNLRLTDLQAAVGVAQIEKINYIFEKKQKLSKIFDQKLSKIHFLSKPYIPPNYEHGYQAYVTWFKPEETIKAIKNNDYSTLMSLHEERNDFMRKLENKGISTRMGTHAVHIQNYYKNKYNIDPMKYPVAFAADRLSVALPFYVEMTDEEIEYLFTKLEEGV